MSMHTFINYGYGIYTTDIKKDDVTLEKVEKFISLAPTLNNAYVEWKEENKDASVDDILEYFVEDNTCSGCGYYGLASLFTEVIGEVEGVYLTACDDYNGNFSVMYQPCYPWQMDSKDKEMTEDKLDSIFNKYIKIFTNDTIYPSYIEAENCC